MKLSEIISREGVQLTPHATHHKGRCPFHDDKNPSFVVYDRDNYWICFGCGEAGDAIEFIMLKRKLQFKQAVNYLGVLYDTYQTMDPCKNMVEIIEEEEKQGVNIWEKYGRDFINSLLYQELIRLSTPTEENNYG